MSQLDRTDEGGLPTENQVGRALRYLAESDQMIAEAKAKLKADEIRLKITEAQEFLAADGPQGERAMKAKSSDAYKTAVDQYENALTDYEILSAKRERAHTLIDVWRTIEASRRRA